ncbi:MerR family transcriptional regulator [Actinoplanes ianthinogenes]|nr:MerR family transcriptional regulator [Actinoplanes ianthinogenes]
MRISDLSRQSGVPVATIKFYLREQLLPPGEATGRNQATYFEEHLRRLQLIKVFTTIGQLDLTSVRRLLTAIDDESLPVTGLYETLNRVRVTTGDLTPDEGPAVATARQDVDRLIAGAGWRVRPDAATRSQLAIVLAAMRRLDCDASLSFFDDYVVAADRLARKEVSRLPLDGVQRAAALARGLLLEEAFAAIHRLAVEHHAERHFPDEPVDS